MGKKITTILLATILLVFSCMSGCGGLSSPRTQELAAEQLFTDTVLAVKALYNAGKLSPADAQLFATAIVRGDEALDTWLAAAEDGKNYPNHVAMFNWALNTLLDLQAKYTPVDDPNDSGGTP